MIFAAQPQTRRSAPARRYRHGIDLKTHSQCQRSAAKLPSPHTELLRAGIRFRFIYRMLSARWRYAALHRVPGGAYRDRTDDPLLAKQVLSQLS